ncbi:hypothetical protein GTA62_14610 [Roseobacter sp. HKCCD9010]|uniref:hypothetical protein n=1 Tax=unclassified Roseobacter TaxID=196798 RepID=UPI001492B69D|nr:MULTISPECIES: hypothetical protein [unclassified Roseobacter]MBF9050658.1 hypothetical protein [Rhodobacterales bacterium HKCCD4356]NNV11924.1 hypothetical protein [Roseobacter sp. HKCCD7357]NNV16937.1 hypothetical protein [Roseobacter sp. HKCCD8768]NNV26166.1 hypothetical protein [Roseobacter sp. HKCCD8192]NNV30658.1 hypothetical protein [Roseobacter sp. HKCCD9061]
MFGPFAFRKPEKMPEGKSMGEWRRLMWVVWKERDAMSMGRTAWAWMALFFAVLAIIGFAT